MPTSSPKSHGKEMVVRGALGAGLPSAGVGCAFSREALGRLAEARGGLPFDSDSLTEDYELGLRIAEAGGRCAFVRTPRGGGLVATREYFPGTLAAAGPAEGALDDRHRSVRLGPARLERRRRGALDAASRPAVAARRAPALRRLSRAGPVAGAEGVAGRGRRGPGAAAAPLSALVTVNLGLLGWRLAVRAGFTAAAYGWREGLRAVPRMAIGNVVLVLAAASALSRYRALRRGGRPRWDKTAHIFPSAPRPNERLAAAALPRHRAWRLGGGEDGHPRPALAGARRPARPRAEPRVGRRRRPPGRAAAARPAAGGPDGERPGLASAPAHPAAAPARSRAGRDGARRRAPAHDAGPERAAGGPRPAASRRPRLRLLPGPAALPARRPALVALRLVVRPARRFGAARRRRPARRQPGGRPARLSPQPRLRRARSPSPPASPPRCGAGPGAEAALGLDWRPSRRVPVHLLAERRQALGREGRSAFALTFYGGVSDAPLGPFRIDAYAQAGIVGARSRDPFADGSLRLSLPLGGRIRLGAGAWAAAQPGVARLDLGPQAALRLPVAGRAVTVAADWRVRVAGDARARLGPDPYAGDRFLMPVIPGGTPSK